MSIPILSASPYRRNDALRSLLQGLFADERPRSSAQALTDAATRARGQGLLALILGVQAPADAAELAAMHAAIAMQCLRHGQATAPTIFLSAGPIAPQAVRGQAAQLALALALALDGHRAVHGVVCTTGGAGSAGHAVVWDPGSVARLQRLRVDLGALAMGGDAEAAFQAIGDCAEFALELQEEFVLRAILVTQDS